MNQFDKNVLQVGVVKALQLKTDDTKRVADRIIKTSLGFSKKLLERVTNEDLSSSELHEVLLYVGALGNSVANKLGQNRKHFIDVLGRKASREHELTQIFFPNAKSDSEINKNEDLYLTALAEQTTVLNELRDALVKVEVEATKRYMLIDKRDES